MRDTDKLKVVLGDRQGSRLSRCSNQNNVKRSVIADHGIKSVNQLTKIKY